MVRKRYSTKLVLTWLLTLACAETLAQDQGYYQHGELNQILYQEKDLQSRTEDLEREAAQRRDDYERQKRDVEQQIAAHRFEIEQLKTREATAEQELKTLEVEIGHVRDKVAIHEEEQKKTSGQVGAVLQQLNARQAELREKQAKLEQVFANLRQLRKRSEAEIYTKSIELKRMESDAAHLQTKVAAAETKRSALEAEEMKVRLEWMQAKKQLTDTKQQQDAANAELADAKQRWTQAYNDLAEVKVSLLKAQKERDQAVAKAKQDVARYEKEISDANRAKILAETEQVRLASEAEKMQEYTGRIRRMRDDAVEQGETADGLVLRTKVAVESARTELNKVVASNDREVLAREKEQSRTRGLAAAAEAYQMLDGGRPWKTRTRCKIYLKPDNDTKVVGVFDRGRELVGKDLGDGWVKIDNGTGKTVYVHSICGGYAD